MHPGKPKADLEQTQKADLGFDLGLLSVRFLYVRYCRVKGQRSIKVVIVPRGEMGSNDHN